MVCRSNWYIVKNGYANCKSALKFELNCKTSVLFLMISIFVSSACFCAVLSSATMLSGGITPPNSLIWFFLDSKSFSKLLYALSILINSASSLANSSIYGCLSLINCCNSVCNCVNWACNCVNSASKETRFFTSVS